MIEVHLCAVCDRIVRPVRQDTLIGNLQVAPAHHDSGGEPCHGQGDEVVTGWDDER